MRRRVALMTKTLSEMKDPQPFIVTECTDIDYRYTVTPATVHRPPENRLSADSKPTFSELLYCQVPYCEPTFREPTYGDSYHHVPTYREPTYREPTYSEPTYRE
jgi:hypothetical protein